MVETERMVKVMKQQLNSKGKGVRLKIGDQTLMKWFCKVERMGDEITIRTHMNKEQAMKTSIKSIYLYTRLTSPFKEG